MAQVTCRDLEAWQVSMELVGAIYCLTRLLPEDERFGLTSQMRRAAVSVPANIAEGYGRFRRGDYRHHVSIARGSAIEIDTLLEVARQLGYVTEEASAHVWELSQRTIQLLTKLLRSLQE